MAKLPPVRIDKGVSCGRKRFPPVNETCIMELLAAYLKLTHLPESEVDCIRCCFPQIILSVQIGR